MNDVNDISYDVPGLWEQYVQSMRNKSIDRPRIVIHGNGGKNNMGDDAILHVLIHRVLKHFPDARITVVCFGPDVVLHRYKYIPDFRAFHFRSWGTLRAIMKNDLYIIGGGGIINWTNAYSGFNRFRIFDMKGKFLYFAIFFARLFGSMTNFYAIGATSFQDPVVKLLARIVIPLSDVVSVRDSLSLGNLKRIGIKRTIHHILDPAFSMEPAPREKALEVLREWGIKERKRPLVGLTLRYVLDGVSDNEVTLSEAAKLVQFLIEEKGCDVFFIPTSQHPRKWVEDDLHFAREVRRRLGNVPHCFVMEKYYDPDVMMAVLREMDFSILERLHAMILSCKTGVPIFAVSYDNKVLEFAKIAARRDIPIDPPEVVSVAEVNDGGIIDRVEPHIDKMIAQWERKKDLL